MSKLNTSFLKQLSINPRYALEGYQAILLEGKSPSLSDAFFMDVVRHLTTIFLRFEDYIHSNNLLQVAKSEVPLIENEPWYQYASLTILTYRLPRYIFQHPAWLIQKLEWLLHTPSFNPMIEAFLYRSFQQWLQLLDWVDTSTKLSIYGLVDKLSKSSLPLTPDHHAILDQIKAQTLPRTLVSTPSKVVVQPASVIQSTNPKMRDPKASILIVGDLVMKKDDVYGIAKDYGLDPKRLEFVAYHEAKHYSFRKLYYSNQFAGIILGPIPHKVQDLGDETSLVQVLKGEGYPFTYIAQTANELKLNKQQLKKGFLEIVQFVNSGA